MAATMTSTFSIVQQASPKLLEPSSPSRVVRFDSECVLIPEPSKPTKPTKVYTLPLWKKRSNDADPDAASSSRAPPSPEATHVVFKVPIPRFISRSPSRGRGTPSSPTTAKPLSPCLVNRDLSVSPPTMPKAIRRTSLPLPLTTCDIPKPDALTVPLRPCCSDCVTITEESVKVGDEWQEKFSRGARRRRSASLDNGDFNLNLDVVRGMHPTGSLPTQVDVPGTRYRPSTFALTVDEVDKRRKSLEHTEEEMKRFRSASPRSSTVFHSPTGYASPSYTLACRSSEREASTSSVSSTLSTSSDIDIPPRRPKSSPIQEEDEDQLFPLPSPRRSPNNSPASSVLPTPNPSPSASTACLAPPGASLKSGSDELLPMSLTRKPSVPDLKPSALTLTIPDVIPSRTTPINIPSKPQLDVDTSRELPANGASNKSQFSPPASPVQSKSRAIPNPLASPRAQAASSPPKTRRPSFSLPSIKDALKGAGADMLKGVTSMGSGSVGAM
ncbi:hypothetical protein H0H92_009888 [Tricholoma furcatifolium]|nr:hypothetical protein H0H92_009888 [Tricholoma furcatifolium]